MNLGFIYIEFYLVNEIKNIYVTSQGQFIGQNQGQTQNVRFVTVLAVFFCRTNVSKIIEYRMYIS